MEKSKTKKYFLVDNGSLRPESVLYIRDIAHQLSKVSGKKVEPAGIMHSHKVDPLKLNRIPGLSMEAFFQSMDSNELECINFIPMFLGPSLAITDWLKGRADAWFAAKPGREYQLKKKLPGIKSGFSTASMERRAGEEYAFNDPLLEKLLAEICARGERNVIVAQLFLAPGRHAGSNGDITKICLPFEKDGVRIKQTPTLGKHPYLIEILGERLREFQYLGVRGSLI